MEAKGKKNRDQGLINSINSTKIVDPRLNIGAPQGYAIPPEQWELPAGFKPDGSFATLAEVVSDPTPTYSLETIPWQKRKDLIVERLRRQPDYPTKYMLGAGVVNRERAIAEVEAQTRVGKVIQESEQRVIQMMRKEAQQQ